MLKVIEKKCDPDLFDLVALGKKDFDLRLNDFKAKVGDILFLREFDRETKKYTRRLTYKNITKSYIIRPDVEELEKGIEINSIVIRPLKWWSVKSIKKKGLLVMELKGVGAKFYERRTAVYNCLAEMQPDDEYWGLWRIWKEVSIYTGVENLWIDGNEIIEVLLETMVKQGSIKKIKFFYDYGVKYGYRISTTKHQRDIGKLMKKDHELHIKLWDMYPNEEILYISTTEWDLIKVVAHDKSDEKIWKIEEKYREEHKLPEDHHLSSTFGYPPERRTYDAYGRKIKVIKEKND